MWVSEEEVTELTGQTVSLSEIVRAQAIIESYVGRTESEVTKATDTMLLARATAYQAVYMKGADDMVFGTSGAKQILQFGNMVTYREGDTASPFVSPLAQLACQRLSWKRIRSIKTGTIFDRPLEPYRWEED